MTLGAMGSAEIACVLLLSLIATPVSSHLATSPSLTHQQQQHHQKDNANSFNNNFPSTPISTTTTNNNNKLQDKIDCSTTNCSTCVSRHGCGWCSTTNTCILGNSTSPANPASCPLPTSSSVPPNPYYYSSCPCSLLANTCSSCTAYFDCGWCASTRLCLEGTWRGAGVFDNKTTNSLCPTTSWKWLSNTCSSSPSSSRDNCTCSSNSTYTSSCGSSKQKKKNSKWCYLEQQQQEQEQNEYQSKEVCCGSESSCCELSGGAVAGVVIAVLVTVCVVVGVVVWMWRTGRKCGKCAMPKMKLMKFKLKIRLVRRVDGADQATSSSANAEVKKK